MIKMTGYEWKRFYNEDETAWPKEAWHEEEEMTIDGVAVDEDFDLSDVPDDAMIELSGGIVHFSDTSVANYSNRTQKPVSLEEHFNQWRRRQKALVLVLVVEMANEDVDAVRAAIVAAGGTVVACGD